MLQMKVVEFKTYLWCPLMSPKRNIKLIKQIGNHAPTFTENKKRRERPSCKKTILEERQTDISIENLESKDLHNHFLMRSKRKWKIKGSIKIYPKRKKISFTKKIC